MEIHLQINTDKLLDTKSLLNSKILVKTVNVIMNVRIFFSHTTFCSIVKLYSTVVKDMFRGTYHKGDKFNFYQLKIRSAEASTNREAILMW